MSGASGAGGTGSGAAGSGATALGGNTQVSSGAEAGSVAAEIASMIGRVGGEPNEAKGGPKGKSKAGTDEAIEPQTSETSDEVEEFQAEEDDNTEVFEGSESEEESVEDDAPEADDSKNELLEELRAMRAELQEMKQSRGGEEQKAEKAEPLMDLVNDDSYADYMSSAEGLNKFANHLVQSMRQVMLQEMYPIITNEATRIATIFEYNRLFYTQNKDLTGKEEIVQEVFKELQGRNPKITISELFTKGAKEARRRIGGQNVAKSKEQPPAGFARPRAGGQRPTKGKQPPSVKQEIADLLGIKR